MKPEERFLYDIFTTMVLCEREAYEYDNFIINIDGVETVICRHNKLYNIFLVSNKLIWNELTKYNINKSDLVFKIINIVSPNKYRTFGVFY
jgi:hypothetical protein